LPRLSAVIQDGEANPLATVGSKNANVRVRLITQPTVTEIRVWAAHERVAVKREEGKK
jgi:hypothetical protein